MEECEYKSKINNRYIKSSYIIKTILSFLNEKQKLNMIIYNKELQKKCLVDIEDYKKISLKYRIGERNGKGKEYIKYTKILIFEGEYLNGKRNGIGKEYYHDKELEFEGKYLNGERNGKGKEYFKNGILEFEGEYLNGKRNGKGKEYYFDGKLRYEGEYLNGKKWDGKGYNINGNMEYIIKDGKGYIKEYILTVNLIFEGE